MRVAGEENCHQREVLLAEASSDGNVSLWKIVPFEQDGQVKLTGTGIGKAVTHVKASRVTPLAEAIECRNGGAAYLGADRHDLRLHFFEKAIEDDLGILDRRILRRLRIFGQRDKLKANRSKGAETWA